LDIFGGFFIILWMAGLFLTIIWFILPFVIFSIKSRCDELSSRVATIDNRLDTLQQKIDNLSACCPGRSNEGASILANQQELK